MNLRAVLNLPGVLAGAFFVIDTCTLIDAIKTEDFARYWATSRMLVTLLKGLIFIDKAL